MLYSKKTKRKAKAIVENEKRKAKANIIKENERESKTTKEKAKQNQLL